MCNCGNTITTSSVCSSCVPNDCACPIKDLSTDCIKYTGEDLPCTEIKEGTLMTEAFSQLDTYLCDLSTQLANSFSLISVGAGTRVYKGVDGIGRKEIRSIKPTNTILTVGLSTDNKEIEIGIDTTVLGQFVQANQITYAAANIGSGSSSYKNSTTVGNNVTFNFRKINSTDTKLTVTENASDISLDLDDTLLEQFVKNNQYTYSMGTTGSGASVYNNTGVLGNSNIFNLRKIKSTDSRITITEGPLDINITLANTIPTVSGSVNYIPRFTPNGTTLGNSIIYQDPSTNYIGIGTTTTSKILTVSGDIQVNLLTVGRGSGDNYTNVAAGFQALSSHFSGQQGHNVAVGFRAAQFTTTGQENMALGFGALQYNLTGSHNHAIGNGALVYQTTDDSVANGFLALAGVNGINNTAMGMVAAWGGGNGFPGGPPVGIGTGNTAIGAGAIYDLTDGNQNTAVGNAALGAITNGSENVGIGFGAAGQGAASFGNIAIGSRAMFNSIIGDRNTVIGHFAQATDFSECVVLGAFAGATGSNQFVVGSSTANAGSIVTETNTSTKVWNVVINGVAVKILLA